MKVPTAVYETRKNARYVMAYICANCKQPSIAFGNDPYGRFAGECPNGHTCTVDAPRR